MAQISATVNQTLIDAVNEIAIKDKRSFSSTVELLLQKAINERNRKRKKDNTGHNTSDTR